MEILRHLEEKGIRFNPVQAQALTTGRTPTLLLAVPGSGKTTVLVARLAALLERGADPERICCLSFSRESAGDMGRRFGELFGDLFPKAPDMGTIHSLCLRILTDFSRQSGRPLPKLTGSEEAPGSAAIMRRCAEEMTGTSPDEELLSDLLSKTGLCKNRMLSKGEISSLPDLPPYFLSIFTRYEAVKKAERLMDYDDLLLFSREILGKRPAFLQSWRERYDYWNVDEGQDLSPVQTALLELLAPEGKGLFLVGDEDQSIYGFRGADPSGILQFPKTFPGARVLKMEHNHRSRPEILSLCEGFIRQSPERFDKLLIPTRPEGGAVERVSSRDMSDAFQEAAAIIRETPPGETMGILYRNNLSACALSLYLQEARIPFRLDAGPVSLIKYHAKTMAALLFLCANPYDLEAFRYLDYRPDLDQLLYQNVLLRADGAKSVPELLREAAPLSPRGGSALNMAEVLEDCQTLSPYKALETLETKLALGRRLRQRWEKGDPLIRMRYSQLRWLCETSPDFPTLFVRMEAASAPAAYRPEEAQVTLSTIHSAKGLEFDTVILWDCFDGVLPGKSALLARKYQDDGPYWEEMRLFYVGATRARDRLLLFDPPELLPNLRLSRFGYAFLSASPRRPSKAEGFAVGDPVSHRLFGAGVIQSFKNGGAKVFFESCGEKTLSLAHCVKMGFLRRKE